MQQQTQQEFSNSLEFSEYIENLCKDSGNYIDAVIQYCAEHFIDLEEIKPMIHVTLKEKIRAEAIDQNMMKSLGQLEF